jgi:hypothetical protein
MFYRLPLRISVVSESVSVCDADNRILSYTYFEDEKSRRDLTGRLTRDEAIEVARIIARAMTAAAGG